jgi:hypothetical protein
MMTNAKNNSTREHAPQGDKPTGVKPQRLKLGSSGFLVAQGARAKACFER